MPWRSPISVKSAPFGESFADACRKPQVAGQLAGTQLCAKQPFLDKEATHLAYKQRVTFGLLVYRCNQL